MDKNRILDARGLSCPQPALMAKETLSRLGSGTVEVLLDNATACVNVSRIATKAGWNVREELSEESFRLVLTK